LPEVTPSPPAKPPAGEFGDAAEDGLLMLAALEKLSSLEPDYCDDQPVEEASITIVDHFVAPGGAAEAGDGPALDADDYAAYHGPVEEATVEIVEVRPAHGPRRGR
jgi:hypothetical protein